MLQKFSARAQRRSDIERAAAIIDEHTPHATHSRLCSHLAEISGDQTDNQVTLFCQDARYKATQQNRKCADATDGVRRVLQLESISEKHDVLSAEQTIGPSFVVHRIEINAIWISVRERQGCRWICGKVAWHRIHLAELSRKLKVIFKKHPSANRVRCSQMKHVSKARPKCACLLGNHRMSLQELLGRSYRLLICYILSIIAS